jgi:hypothetical protein
VVIDFSQSKSILLHLQMGGMLGIDAQQIQALHGEQTQQGANDIISLLKNPVRSI